MESIAAASRAIQSGRTTPLALVEQCLARIRQLDDRVRAWVLVDEAGALEQAARLTDEARRGGARGLLFGIPLAIKDIVDVAGFPTRAGSPVTDPRPVPRDATVVARLREAGAILLGKTVTTEFASFDPPPTRNPWNLTRTPGGSSSGSAAAVALQMCLGAIGSQTGGSITRPASYCGVAGCKPTFGRVSLAGILPLAFGLDHPGPIARSVSDLAVLLQVIAGPDDRDPCCAAEPAGDYLSGLGRVTHPLRLGLVREFFLDAADEPVRRVCERALGTLREHGAELVTVPLPASFADAIAMHRRLMAVGAADVHRHWYPARKADYSPRIAALIEEGLATKAIDYAEAVRHQCGLKREILSSLAGVNALVMPATSTTAPGAETTGDPRFNSPWSYTGLPVVSLPCGVAPDGLPVALQLVGPPMAEGPLLATAAWCEAALAFTALPPAP